MRKIKPAILIIAAVLMISGVAFAATTFGNLINIGNMLVYGNMEIRPEATPETGSLVDALDEAGFVIDEEGNVNIPNMLTFGGPEPASPIPYADGSVSWASGTVTVKAAGAWIDSHPVEGPTGAACAIISPYDENPIGETDVSLTTATRNLNIPAVYNLWQPTFCQLTQTGGNAVDCVVEKVGSVFYLRALQANGNTATSVSGARATWQANITSNDLHQYTCGIVRDPSADTDPILQWKLASLEASRIPDDQFFVFVKDENGNWFNDDDMCLDFGCILPNYSNYRGLQVAWFIWKVAE